MRPTSATMSEMPGPKVYNPWWGFPDVMRQKGTVQYGLAPNHQRPMKNLLRNYLFNGYRRLSAQAPYWIVPFALGYATYTWAKRYDEWQNSKAARLSGHVSH